MDLTIVLSMVMTIDVAMAMLGGAVLGVIVGALPGIGSAATMAILLPISYKMDPITAVSFLSALWAASVYGGSWTAILINVPGESMSVATAFDGYPMTRQGKSLNALGASTMSAFVGGMAGVILLIFGAPFLNEYAVAFGPPEYVWVNVFALLIIAVSMKGQMLKGIIAGLLGLSLSLFGIDSVLGVPRYTFGTLYMQNGISVLSVMVGLFGFSEIIELARMCGSAPPTGKMRGSLIAGMVTVFKYWKTTAIGIIIGSIIGFLPGIGGTAANLLAYTETKRRSKDPDSFGKGNIEGIIAAETASNAIQGTAMIPALTLGIPGSASAAILLMALIMQGFQPGRMLFQSNPNFVGAFFATQILSQFAMVIIGLAMLPLLSYITRLANEFLTVSVGAFCLIGVYAVNGNLLDVLVAVIFGFVGYFLAKHKFQVVALVVGLLLGAPTEMAFTQSLQISGGDYAIFFTRHLSQVMFGMCLALVALTQWSQIKGLFIRKSSASS